MKDWKSCERKMAILLGGKRVPVSGRARGDNPDIQHECLSIEVKSRKSIPAWLKVAVNQGRLRPSMESYLWPCCTKTVSATRTA